MNNGGKTKSYTKRIKLRWNFILTHRKPSKRKAPPLALGKESYVRNDTKVCNLLLLWITFIQYHNVNTDGWSKKYWLTLKKNGEERSGAWTNKGKSWATITETTIYTL